MFNSIFANTKLPLLDDEEEKNAYVTETAKNALISNISPNSFKLPAFADNALPFCVCFNLSPKFLKNKPYYA